MKDTLIVFTPKEKNLFQISKYKRFLISHNQLEKYITKNNANQVLESIKNQQTNKTTIRFRKYGKIDIYLK